MSVTAKTIDRPLGATRCMELLTNRVGVEVTYADFDHLVETGHLSVVDWYKRWPLYDVDVVDALEAELVRGIVEQRTAWVAESITADKAGSVLGVPGIAVLNAATASGASWSTQRVPAWLPEVVLGQAEAPSAEAADAAAAFRANLHIAAGRAAEWLGLRRTDFDHLVRAELLAPVGQTEIEVGRRGTATVPLFAVEDLDRALEDPRVPWPRLREVAPGDRSPLLALLKAPVPNRPATLRGWLRAAEESFGVGFSSRWDRWMQRWCIAWDVHAEAAPTAGDVAQHLELDVRAAAAGLRPDGIVYNDAQLAAVWWARHMLKPGVAVIIDTETTGLYDPDVVEVAVIDAATGRVRFHSRVRPSVAFEEEASAVNGHTSAALADAPEWEEVLPKLRRATHDRVILGWNAEFDEYAVRATTLRRTPRVRHTGHLARQRNWECLMQAAMNWTNSWYRIALNGPHDAVGDCRAARNWLLNIAADGTEARSQAGL